MDNREAVNWLINISADIGKAEHSDLWHYEQALTEIKDMLESEQPEKRTGERAETHACDLISRQAAIDGKISIQCANGVEIYSDEAVPVEYLKALPSAQSEQIWIPCSERLPEESGYYIITAHDGVGHRTTFVKYQKKAKSWDLTGARSYWRVIAWMPLPEPYQGKERRTDG